MVVESKSGKNRPGEEPPDGVANRFAGFLTAKAEKECQEKLSFLHDFRKFFTLLLFYKDFSGFVKKLPASDYEK
jgi:hypothetical protein